MVLSSKQEEIYVVNELEAKMRVFLDKDRSEYIVSATTLEMNKRKHLSTVTKLAACCLLDSLVVSFFKYCVVDGFPR